MFLVLSGGEATTLKGGRPRTGSAFASRFEKERRKRQEGLLHLGGGSFGRSGESGEKKKMRPSGPKLTKGTRNRVLAVGYGKWVKLSFGISGALSISAMKEKKKNRENRRRKACRHHWEGEGGRRGLRSGKGKKIFCVRGRKVLPGAEAGGESGKSK